MCSVDQEAVVQDSTDTSLRTSRANVNPNLTTKNLPSTISGFDSPGPKTPICRFFASKHTCPYGDRCRYRHDTPKSSKPVKPVCRHFLQSQCCYGNRCKFYHPEGDDLSTSDSAHLYDSPGMLDVNDFPSISQSKLTTQGRPPTRTQPRVSEQQRYPPNSRPLEQKRVLHHHDGSQSTQVELQLEAFFKRAATITPKPAVSHPNRKQPQKSSDRVAQIEQLELELLRCENTTTGDDRASEKFIHAFKFEPSDPEWDRQYGVPVLQMMATFPETYPELPISLKLIDEGILPKSVVLAINTRLDKQAALMHKDSGVSTGHTPVFRFLLNWLDKNVAEIANWDDDEEEPFVSDSSSEYTETGDEDEQGVESDEEEGSDYLRPTKRGTEIRIMDFTLSKNVATLQLTKLKLTVQCTRCKNKGDIMCSPEKTCSEVCGKCQSCFTVTFHPDVTHPSNNTIGFIDILGCKPVDVVLPSCDFTIICLECQKDQTLSGWGFGQALVTWCRGCHSRLEVATEHCKFIIHQTGPQKAIADDVILATRKLHRKKVKDTSVFQVGRPLPNLGTCEHYKKSHRWLRFPCCGKTYPCDVCHDRSEDHLMKRANRMICGFCSKEQRYNGNKPCTLCGSDMAFIKTSAYWEGGKGCRNKTKMKRTDPHKYKQENKTVSKKNERVGEKGKANRSKNHPSV